MSSGTLRDINGGDNPDSPMRTVTFRLNEKDYERLQKLAELRGKA